MAYLRAQYDTDGPTMRGLTHNSRLANASTLELFDEDVLERPAWHAEANCKGAATNLFFSERGENAKVEQAKEVCAGCTVRGECLDYAMRNHITDGIWGGLSERQRRTIRPSYKRMAPCELCGTRYDYNHPGQRYCSDECRKESHRRVNVAYTARAR